jgi:hypothetical protein
LAIVYGEEQRRGRGSCHGSKQGVVPRHLCVPLPASLASSCGRGAELTDETGVWVWQYWIEQEERIFFILLTCGP